LPGAGPANILSASLIAAFTDISSCGRLRFQPFEIVLPLLRRAEGASLEDLPGRETAGVVEQARPSIGSAPKALVAGTK